VDCGVREPIYKWESQIRTNGNECYNNIVANITKVTAVGMKFVRSRAKYIYIDHNV
jgi:hypothetical protein